MTSARPQRTRTYTSPVYDSRRWDGFKPRRGDIVVCTPAKGGTTWTQMLCALIVHQSSDFPLPLNRLTRWLDRPAEPIEAVLADLERQTYRRIVKTHTPLDGLPYFEEVSYVFCGRDPRDIYLSQVDHMANLSLEVLKEEAARAGTDQIFVMPEDPNEFFPKWLNTGEQPWMDDGLELGSVLYLSRSYWAFRKLPNLLFLHYADLSMRLDEEMRRLSAFLGVAVNERRWPALREAASFDAMRARANETAPGAHVNEWRSNRDFFRAARLGQWRTGLSARSLALYEAVAAQRLDDALRRWLERGRVEGFDPAL
jgi:hypothetical protein